MNDESRIESGLCPIDEMVGYYKSRPKEAGLDCAIAASAASSLATLLSGINGPDMAIGIACCVLNQYFTKTGRVFRAAIKETYEWDYISAGEARKIVAALANLQDR